MKHLRLGVLFLAVSLALAAASLVGHAGPHRVINASSPGQEIDIKRFLVKGKINVFDFYSEFCPPCKRISPYLEQLADKDAGVVVNKVDINRADVQGIDWDSPVVNQYGFQNVPHFIIYDARGKKIAEGDDARKKVFELMLKAGIR